MIGRKAENGWQLTWIDTVQLIFILNISVSYIESNCYCSAQFIRL